MQSDSNLPPCGEIYKDTLGDTVLTSFVTVTVMKMMMIRVIRYHLLRSYSVRIYRYIPSFNFCIRLFLLGNDPPPISGRHASVLPGWTDKCPAWMDRLQAKQPPPPERRRKQAVRLQLAIKCDLI